MKERQDLGYIAGAVKVWQQSYTCTKGYETNFKVIVSDLNSVLFG